MISIARSQVVCCERRNWTKREISAKLLERKSSQFKLTPIHKRKKFKQKFPWLIHTRCLNRAKKLFAASSEVSFVCVLVLSLKMFLGFCVLFENFFYQETVIEFINSRADLKVTTLIVSIKEFFVTFKDVLIHMLKLWLKCTLLGFLFVQIAKILFKVWIFIQFLGNLLEKFTAQGVLQPKIFTTVTSLTNNQNFWKI